MSTLYHQKYHSYNHHTTPVSSDIYPDAAHDPIASHEQPFQGDFVMNGGLFGNGIEGNSSNVCVTLSSNDIALHAIGDVNILGNVSVKDLKITAVQEKVNRIVSTNEQYNLTLNTSSFDTRVWKIVDTTNLNDFISFKAPEVVDVIKTDYYNSINHYSQSFIDVIVSGTAPLYFQWYKNNILLEGETKKYIRTDADGEYTLVARNNAGVTSTVVIVPFDEDTIVTNKYVDITTHDGYDIYIDYTYLYKDEDGETDFIVDHTGSYIRV